MVVERYFSAHGGDQFRKASKSKRQQTRGIRKVCCNPTKEQLAHLRLTDEVASGWARCLITIRNAVRAKRSFKHTCSQCGILILGAWNGAEMPIVQTIGDKIVIEVSGAPQALLDLIYSPFVIGAEGVVNTKTPNLAKAKEHVFTKTESNGVRTTHSIPGRYRKSKSKSKEREATHVETTYKKRTPDCNALVRNRPDETDWNEPYQEYVNQAYAQLGACDAKREQENIGESHESQFVAFGPLDSMTSVMLTNIVQFDI